MIKKINVMKSNEQYTNVLHAFTEEKKIINAINLNELHTNVSMKTHCESSVSSTEEKNNSVF